MIKIRKADGTYLYKGYEITFGPLTYRFNRLSDGCFSGNFEKDLDAAGEVDGVILSHEEYKYLLDCEDMLKNMSRLLGERIDENKNP